MLQPRGREANEFESGAETGSRADDIGGRGLAGVLDTLVAAGLAIPAVGYLLLTRVDSAGGLAVVVVVLAIIHFGAGPLMTLGTDKKLH